MSEKKKRITFSILILKLIIVFGIIFMAIIFAYIYLLPEYRPRLGPGESYGIDVSSHQSKINWSEVADDNISFAYIKATEGSELVDERFITNWRDAKESNIRVGAYHFFSFCSPGVTQAESFLATVPNEDDNLSPALDIEHSPFCEEGLSQEDFDKEVTDFINLVEKTTNRKVIVYISDDFDDIYDVESRYDRKIWEHRYLLKPSTENMAVWQVGNIFHIAGIEGGVDLNVGKISDLK